MHNTIIISPLSKKLLRDTIHEVVSNKSQKNISIEFIKEYNKIHYIIKQLQLLPIVLEQIICEYINDIFTINTDVIYYDCGYAYPIILAIISFNIYDYNIPFEIYHYNDNLLNVHLMTTKNDMITTHDDATYMCHAFNNYMKKYYNKNNYIGVRHNTSTSTITHVNNHKLLKHFIIIAKILIDNMKKLIH